MRLPTGSAAWDDGEEIDEDAEPHLSATAEHDEVELGPLDEPTIAEDEGGEEIGGSTRAMSLDEVEWENVEDPPGKRQEES